MARIFRIAFICVLMLSLSAYVVSAAESGNYTYTISGSKATITDVDSVTSGDVEIPSTLGGRTVTAIGDDAFSFCSNITSLVIPDTVTSIGNSAFCGCSSLKRVEIPSSIKIIKESAFSECWKLEEINVSEANEYISFEDGVLYCGTTAIWGSDIYFAKNSEVKIKEGITKIGAYAFAMCDSLTKVELPESVNSIGDYAFEVCKNLKEIVILQNVTSIGEYAFMENFALESVTYKGTSEPTMGKGVFENCTALKSVTVPSDYDGDTFGGYTAVKADKGTKILISEDGAVITVENVTDIYNLIVASYKGDKLIDCKITEILKDGEYKLSNMSGFVYDKLNVDIIRVFLWKDMIDFEPICGGEEYKY